MEALSARAAALPTIDLDAAARADRQVDRRRDPRRRLYGFAGRSTASSSRLHAELGEFTTLATGGLAGAVVPHCRRSTSPTTCSRSPACGSSGSATVQRLAVERRDAVPWRAAYRSMGARGSEIPNRVMLAPLAGIGNWFVRLQAKRFGAGLAVSEMISTFAIHYGNGRRSTSCSRAPRARGRWRSSSSATTRRSCAPPPPTSPASARRPHRPQHGLPGPEGDEDRRGRGDDQGPRHSPSPSRAPRARAPACRSRSSCARRSSRAGWRASSWRAGWSTRPAWPGITLPPAQRGGPPQGHAGLRPRRRARRGAAGPGDRLRRDGGRRAHPLGLRAHRLRGGHAGARRTREPVAVRRRCSASATTSRPPRRCSRSGTGSSIAPRSTWVPTGPRATCESSTLGTSSGSARPRRVQDALQRAETLDEQRAVLLLSCAPFSPVQA